VQTLDVTMRFFLLQILRLHAVHVIKRLVLTGHAPDKFVIARAAPAVNGPVRRQRALLIVAKTGAASAAARPGNASARSRRGRIKINLRAPPVRVRRERIPHAALLQRGEPHHQLAALNAAGVNVFVITAGSHSPANPAARATRPSASSSRRDEPRAPDNSENKTSPDSSRPCSRT